MHTTVTLCHWYGFGVHLGLYRSDNKYILNKEYTFIHILVSDLHPNLGIPKCITQPHHLEGNKNKEYKVAFCLHASRKCLYFYKQKLAYKGAETVVSLMTYFLA